MIRSRYGPHNGFCGKFDAVGIAYMYHCHAAPSVAALVPAGLNLVDQVDVAGGH